MHPLVARKLFARVQAVTGQALVRRAIKELIVDNATNQRLTPGADEWWVGGEFFEGERQRLTDQAVELKELHKAATKGLINTLEKGE